jgi:hypothetical protein
VHIRGISIGSFYTWLSVIVLMSPRSYLGVLFVCFFSRPIGVCLCLSRGAQMMIISECFVVVFRRNRMRCVFHMNTVIYDVPWLHACVCRR